jgi:hypothetical protein
MSKSLVVACLAFVFAVFFPRQECLADEPAVPLPIVGSWNTGQFSRDLGDDFGFDPNWQREMIIAGWPMIPSFEFWEKLRTPNMRQVRSLHYERLWEFSKTFRLPVSFVGENWQDRFRTESPWRDALTDLTITDHPFLQREDGTRSSWLVSPWSDNVHHFETLGRDFGEYLELEFAADYPDAPLVVLYDNAEMGFASVTEAAQDHLCPQWFHDAHERDKVYALDQRYAIRQQALLKALLDACPTWRDKIRVYAYGGFGNEFGQGELTNHADKRKYEVPWTRKFEPYGVAVNAGYVHPWQNWFVDTTRCPQFDSMNVKFAIDEYRRHVNPDFDADTLYWNGRGDSPDRWGGAVRTVMWVMRTRLNRLFTPSAATREVTLDRDYMPLLQAAQEVHRNPVLRRFWQHGTLLTNRWKRDFTAPGWEPLHPNDTVIGYGHHYAWPASLKPGFNDPGDRWFQQRVPINNRMGINEYGNRWNDRWQMDRSRVKEVSVYAICLQHEGDYLLYAHAPRGAVTDCVIEVCPDGFTPRFTATVDVPVGGQFWFGDGLTMEPVLEANTP